jgi:hypothetical protein
MNKEQITVTMPITEYEDLITNVKWWQDRYNSLKRVILKYTTNKDDGSYFVRDSIKLVKDIEEYLNDEDY